MVNDTPKIEASVAPCSGIHHLGSQDVQDLVYTRRASRPAPGDGVSSRAACQAPPMGPSWRATAGDAPLPSTRLESVVHGGLRGGPEPRDPSRRAIPLWGLTVTLEHTHGREGMMGMDPVMVLCQTRMHRPQLGWSQRVCRCCPADTVDGIFRRDWLAEAPYQATYGDMHAHVRWEYHCLCLNVALPLPCLRLLYTLHTART